MYLNVHLLFYLVYFINAYLGEVETPYLKSRTLLHSPADLKLVATEADSSSGKTNKQNLLFSIFNGKPGIMYTLSL